VRTGGQLVVEGLQRWGVEVVFGLPGVQLDWLFDALADDSGIRVVHTRHEQATAYMADGYARATGRVGVCAVVPGPGVLNAAAALSTAYACNSPVLCLVGQVPDRDLGHGRGALHEIPDQLAVLRGTIGWAEHATSPDQVPGLVDEAFTRLGRPGRRRPVAIELPWDMLMASSEATYPPRPVFPPAKAPDAATVAEAARQLVAARRPMIWAGGGTMDAGVEVLALAEALDAPVVLTTEAKGAVSDRHPRVLPSAAATTLLPHADAVVVVGSRFFTSSGEPRLAEGAVVVRIDVDPEEHGRAASPAIGLEADAGLACAALAGAVAACRAPGHRTDGHVNQEITELRRAITDGFAERFEELAAYCAAVRAALPDDGILVDEMTQVGYFARNGFPSYSPRTYIGSGYQGTLGFGYATALGAKVGQPDRAVVSLSGDGGFMYNVAELATAVQHGIGVVVVVFDDGAFGNVKRIQSRTFGREIASTLTNPDFVALAGSFGVKGYRAEGPEALAESVVDALATGGPALVHVPIGPQPEIWGILSGRETLVSLDPA
jgi:acetolactate synthase I/II/III large subunit